MNRIIAALMLVVSARVYAEAPPPPPPPPPPDMVGRTDVPPPPPQLQSGQAMDDGVTIIETQNETIFEYRAGAHLYMVRVVPRVGPPYYFFDQDGDGQLDFQKDDPRLSKINQWVLFRW